MTNSSSAVQTLASAIAYQHHVNGFDSPTTSSESLSTFIQGVKKKHGAPREPKDPLEVQHLRAMIDFLYSTKHGKDGILAPLVLWRTVWLAHMTFYGLLRFGDLQFIRRVDLEFGDEPDEHLIIKMAHCKNDIYSEGTEKLIPSNANESRYCPLKLTLNYLKYLGCGYLGFMLPTCSPGYVNRGNPEKCVPYTLALSDYKELLTSLGFDGAKFGLHSGKRGGATHGANSGMTKDELQRLGNWRSPAMPSKYVDLAIPNRIALSKKLMVSRLSEL